MRHVERRSRRRPMPDGIRAALDLVVVIILHRHPQRHRGENEHRQRDDEQDRVDVGPRFAVFLAAWGRLPA